MNDVGPEEEHQGNSHQDQVPPYLCTYRYTVPVSQDQIVRYLQLTGTGTARSGAGTLVPQDQVGRYLPTVLNPVQAYTGTARLGTYRYRYRKNR